MKSQIKIAIRPNNQITLTCGQWKKKQLPVSQCIINDFDKIPNKQLQEEIEKLAIASALDKMASESQSKRVRANLGIIQKLQQKTEPSKTKEIKPKSFTSVSGQKLRECGAAFDIASQDTQNKGHCVTLTLPANHEAAYKALSNDCAYAINRLFQPIRNHYGNSCLWFFVWEYQKRGALHLHIAVRHDDLMEQTKIADRLIDTWHDILVSIGDRQNCDMFCQKNMRKSYIRSIHNHHAQPIEKACGAYFSKYAGKKESKNDWYCQKYPVSRFWGSSFTVKQIIKENSCCYELDYQGNEAEAEAKMQMIIQNVIEKLNIVSASQYSFDIQLQGKERLNRYQNGRKILSVDANKSIASGTRFTFYCDGIEIKNAMQLIQDECAYF